MSYNGKGIFGMVLANIVIIITIFSSKVSNKINDLLSGTQILYMSTDERTGLNQIHAKIS